jgi:fatty-acyl-CoA synthase
MSQITIDYLATTSFARRPMVWLKLMSEMASSISFSPTFGYELCVRRSANGVNADFDLSNWRVAGIGGEMVRPDVLAQFAECFAPSGFRPEAFLPSYGLAESTLAVSFAPLDRGVKVDHVSREAYERKGLALPSEPKSNGSAHKTRAFVRCGGALSGHSVEIRDSADRVLPERRIGRICIKGPSLMRGYFENPSATAAVLGEDGWLDTGDMGYLLDGEIVVTGRSKDLIICNGRNIWPQDLEWAVESLPGLRPGCVAAFGIDDDDKGERVVIVAECRLTDRAAKAELEREIAAKIHRTAGVECEVLLVPTRSLTFTSSGKLSRAAAKTDYLAGRLMPEEDLDFADDGALLPVMERRVAATSGS